jgi:hypothetical protein
MPRLFTPDDPTILRIHECLGKLLGLWNAAPKGSGFITGALPPDTPEEPFNSVSREQISAFLEVAFWSSLAPNEGRSVQFGAILEPALYPQVPLNLMPFTEPIPFEEGQVAKLAPALPPGHSFVVSVSEGRLVVRGFASPAIEKAMCSVVVTVREPGIVRVKVGWFEPFAIVNGRKNPVIEGTSGGVLPIYLHCAPRHGLQTSFESGWTTGPPSQVLRNGIRCAQLDQYHSGQRPQQ